MVLQELTAIKKNKNKCKYVTCKIKSSHSSETQVKKINFFSVSHKTIKGTAIMSWLSALEPFLFCKHYFNIFLDDLVENVFTQAEIMFSATRLCFLLTLVCVRFSESMSAFV